MALPNFGEVLASRIQVHNEASLHPHAAAERAELFHSIDGGSAELEVLTLLNALVYLYKPMMALETGTGSALTTVSIASALRANGLGHVHTVECNPTALARAKMLVEVLDPDLRQWITFHSGDSRELIRAWPGRRFDFAFFDNEIAFRHLEFEALSERGLLTERAVCVFHDTSRLRGETMRDFNPEMIAALDRQSTGRQWLESQYSRGLRILRLGDMAAKTFRHSGKIGDVIYALPTIRALGGGILYLNPNEGLEFSREAAESLLPLLRQQSYIAEARVWEGEPIDVDLDRFRAVSYGVTNLCLAYLRVFDAPNTDLESPWLQAKKCSAPPVIFSRSLRYRGEPGFWNEVYGELGADAGFVGTRDEHEAFVQEIGQVPYIETPDIQALAEAITGAKLFVGNQSAPLAVAEGLKRPVIQEVSSFIPNCIFVRPDVLCIRSSGELAQIASFAGRYL
jgi:predicted O-methyltransferase YrrM